MSVNNRVCVSRGLNLEKMRGLTFPRDVRKTVCNNEVSIKQGSIAVLTNNNCTRVNPCNSRSSVSAEKRSFRCVSARETMTRHNPLEVSCDQTKREFKGV